MSEEEFAIPENLKHFFKELVKIRNELKIRADMIQDDEINAISDELQNLLKGE